ncbi:hypothetical protein FIU89_11095 [Roseovarius sp. THAF27]|uniref:hypothetical protein n=1 Tax=Roseovarius sp. THAF27 TaxID=2587850 RepID=UPI0012693C49|nr:hypothetical protein [Roseovarius sp. THAF27]QFT81155.1 hypothetical protein FIU89_11095 [Roseovarius sp. THAF27]
MAEENYQVLLFRIDRQAEEIRDLKSHVEKLEKRAVERDQERSAQERKQLLAGISFLGAVIITLGSVLWSYRAVIFKGVN